MAFRKIITLLCILFVQEAAVSATVELGDVSKVGVGRVGDNVVRYVKKFNNNCLEVQVVSPDENWKILSVSSFCTFEGKSLYSDFAYAGFEDISVMNDGLHLTLSIIPFRLTGEELKACHIPIKGIIIGELKCSDK